MSETIRRVVDHPMKKRFDTTPSDAALRAEDGWVDMDVRWLLTRETVGAEHSVFGITVFPLGRSTIFIAIRTPRSSSTWFRVGESRVLVTQTSSSGQARSSSFRRTTTTGSKTPETNRSS